MLESFKRKLQSVKGLLYEVAFSLIHRDCYKNYTHGTHTVMETTRLTVTANHVYLGTSTNALIYESLVNRLGKNLIALAGPKLQLFSQMQPMMSLGVDASMDFCGSDGIFKMVESGIFIRLLRA